MTLNESKCHLLVCGHKDESIFTNVDYNCLWEEYSVKSLEVLIDIDFSFRNYVYNLCKSASRKMSTLVVVRFAQYNFLCTPRCAN